MSKTIVVGCKLPNGLVIEHPMDATKTVELNGSNKSLIIGADYGATDVDADFFEQWLAVHAEFPAVKAGVIFVAKSAADIVAAAKEHSDVLTDLEPMKMKKDRRAKGMDIKPASEKED